MVEGVGEWYQGHLTIDSGSRYTWYIVNVRGKGDGEGCRKEKVGFRYLVNGCTSGSFLLRFEVLTSMGTHSFDGYHRPSKKCGEEPSQTGSPELISWIYNNKIRKKPGCMLMNRTQVNDNRDGIRPVVGETRTQESL